jgi:hypothetical protein
MSAQPVYGRSTAAPRLGKIAAPSRFAFFSAFFFIVPAPKNKKARQP